LQTFPKASGSPGDRLGFMPQGITEAPPPTFAGLLASLASPQAAGLGSDGSGNDDGLLDDVADFSYEGALRNRPGRWADESGIEPGSIEPVRVEPGPSAGALCEGPISFPSSTAAAQSARPLAQSSAQASAQLSAQPKPQLRAQPAAYDPNRISITEIEIGPARPPSRDLKRASVTIRMSAVECARLHARAAESGLTVSAYLRSCTLEVESLRAQVKEALAGLRVASTAGDQKSMAEPPSKFGPVSAPAWGTKLFGRSKGPQRVATA
jgi:hypothetical protein